MIWLNLISKVPNESYPDGAVRKQEWICILDPFSMCAWELLLVEHHSSLWQSEQHVKWHVKGHDGEHTKWTTGTYTPTDTVNNTVHQVKQHDTLHIHRHVNRHVILLTRQTVNPHYSDFHLLSWHDVSWTWRRAAFYGTCWWSNPTCCQDCSQKRLHSPRWSPPMGVYTHTSSRKL